MIYVLVAVVLCAIAGFLFFRTKEEKTECKVSELIIYPIKSCAGISLSSVKVTPTGLEYDRTWMIVNSDGAFVTQRQHPKISLIRPSLTTEHLIVSAPDMPKLVIPLDLEVFVDSEPMACRVFSTNCYGRDQGTEAASWFSKYLGVSVKLVRMDPTFPARRPAESLVKKNIMSNSTQVSYADCAPFLMVSTESIQDLNSRLPSPIDHRRFRPNIVITGGNVAYIEDTFKKLRIGACSLKAIKPCSRCKLTTVDPDAGEFDAAGEPLKTLTEYRKVPKEGAMFGSHLIPLKVDVNLEVGDSIYVSKRKHWYEPFQLKAE